MKQTHKKILGFTGLGLVVATTAVAATLPSPTASAVSSTVTDTIKVTVLSPDPDIKATSDSDATIYGPSYAFTVTYNNLASGKATITNYDDDGNVKYSAVIWNETLDGEPGTKDFALDLNDYGGHGHFVISVVGTSPAGVELEQILSVSYEVKKEDADTDPDSGEADVDVDVPEEEVKKVVVEVYDEDGSLKKTIEISDPKDVETLDLSDLDDGTYTLVIVTKDKDGNVLETEEVTAVVDKDGIDAKVPIEIEDPGDSKTIGEAVITIRDKDGKIIDTIVIPSPTPGSTEEIDLSDASKYPSGEYEITIDYYDEDGNKIGESKTIDVTKSDNSGKAEIDVDTKVDTVTLLEAYIYNSNGDAVRILRADRATGTMYVYDAAGDLLFTVAGGYKDGKFTIPMEGLPYGDYTGLITFKNADGKIVGDSVSVTIKYYGKAIIVPDTGSFFQGLNISREDYLITGLIVFLVIGVVAFGIVKRNHSNTSKRVRINGKRR